MKKIFIFLLISIVILFNPAFAKETFSFKNFDLTKNAFTNQNHKDEQDVKKFLLLIDKKANEKEDQSQELK